MQITIDLPHVFYPGAHHLDNAYALRALLDCLISLNQAFLFTSERRGDSVPGLYRSGVVYDRTEVWDTLPALYQRRYGDCKSLSAALIAQYRHRGRTAIPTFRFRPNTLGGNDFHILVQVDKSLSCPSGWLDPSKVLGMGADENAPWARMPTSVPVINGWK